MSAAGGCEGPQPSKPAPDIVRRVGWASLADPLEGARSVGAVKWCQFTAGHGCEGPHLQASIDHRGDERMAIVSQFPEDTRATDEHI